jgi:hypothetical protein
MTRKERREYQRWKREREGQNLSTRDREFLDLLAKVRAFTHGCDAGNSPWHQTLQRLRAAIEDVGTIMTGDSEYFWTKRHSIGG